MCIYKWQSLPSRDNSSVILPPPHLHLHCSYASSVHFHYGVVDVRAPI